MKDNTVIKKEIFRKAIHLCGAFIPFLLKFYYWPIIIFLSLVSILYSISEILRAKGKNMPLISHITIFALRERDENRFALGPITLVLGIIITALIMPLNYAAAGIFALAFGDGFASLIGKCFGRVKLSHTGGKTLEGSLACFLAVSISVSILTGNLLLGILVGFFAMLIEVLPLLDLDNLLIPISTGYFLQLLCYLFNYTFSF